mmetsp:Transcript_5895/g.12953  ORF Transcript_5895/g.12953 Transcript_5895/m.12953 type:complete len:150 (+) Transcript_5895:136-585(+)|eukprot:CAMPEP_0178413150 /NCGR_PEP_ID=MMETSP0689_2-20121128/22381_1 /TAXON_ID=160604 /ORGANISM="Amphidinium massartii, Strain CS-259" /LENGTH=149 /DNA_ID=CAMNT_0020034417 /DNA_START=133 /DNA_END=582 /DNA_ORIENTATION=-
MQLNQGAVLKAIQAEGELLKRREAQLDERLAVLERLAASIRYDRSTGVHQERRLPSQFLQVGGSSNDTREFGNAFIEQPLLGYYVDRSKVGRREEQVSQQFAVGQEHQLIYGLAGISREGATRNRWLTAIQDHQGVANAEDERDTWAPF